jgi:serine/threonine-protein kinase
MAPEMVLGGNVDARADIYAVGCVGYWLLTGRLVFEEESFIATMLAPAQKDPSPYHTVLRWKFLLNSSS